MFLYQSFGWSKGLNAVVHGDCARNVNVGRDERRWYFFTIPGP